MAAQPVSLRTQIAVTIELLRSGAVDSYALFFDLELSGEDSPEMRLIREVCDTLAVTDDELVQWQQSYLTRLAKASGTIDQQLLERQLSAVITQLRSGNARAFAWFESALYLHDIDDERADCVLAEANVTTEELSTWRSRYYQIPAERRVELETAFNTFRSPNPTA